jgi:hypothetical protein
MNVENWISIIAPFTGIIVAALTASLTYYFTKKNQLRLDESRLKEETYLKYIKALSDNVILSDRNDARAKLSDAHNHILLIGSACVVTRMREFSKYIAIDNFNSKNFNIEEHDKLLTELIKSMREDLYNGKKTNKRYPTISLSGSRGKRE